MANGHGGKRIGAGRKPGSKSKLDLRLQERLKEANADPVDALVDILKAEGDDHRLKIEAAKALMPYAKKGTEGEG
jgi:hypothetical protein